MFNQLNCFDWLHVNFILHTTLGWTLIYILSWPQSLLCVTAATTSTPISKSYKFTILRAKPTRIKPLRQCLWQLPVYINMKYICKFHVFHFLFRQITNTNINFDATFFFHIYDRMFLFVLSKVLFGELPSLVTEM